MKILSCLEDRNWTELYSLLVWITSPIDVILYSNITVHYSVQGRTSNTPDGQNLCPTMHGVLISKLRMVQKPRITGIKMSTFSQPKQKNPVKGF